MNKTRPVKVETQKPHVHLEAATLDGKPFTVIFSEDSEINTISKSACDRLGLSPMFSKQHAEVYTNGKVVETLTDLVSIDVKFVGADGSVKIPFYVSGKENEEIDAIIGEWLVMLLKYKLNTEDMTVDLSVEQQPFKLTPKNKESLCTLEA